MLKRSAKVGPALVSEPDPRSDGDAVNPETPFVTIHAPVLDADPDLHAVRDGIEKMLLQHYDQDRTDGNRARLECNHLIRRTDARGSILILVRSFDKDDKEMHPEILKFDDMRAAEAEFECYENISSRIARFVPQQRKLDTELETDERSDAALLVLPSRTKREVDAIYGVVMHMSSACWQVPGPRMEELEAIADLKALYVDEMLARATMMSRDSQFGSVHEICRVVFGRSGPFDTLIETSKMKVKTTLAELWRSRLESRVDTPEVRMVFPELLPGTSAKVKSAGEQIRNRLEPSNLQRVQENLSQLMKLLKGPSAARTHKATLTLVHGNLDAANIMVDSHANPWYIDFSDVKHDLPLTDVAKLVDAMMLEYTVFPISRNEATSLSEDDLAEQLHCNEAKAAMGDLQKFLRKTETNLEHAVNKAFKKLKYKKFIPNVVLRLADDSHDAEMMLEDGKAFFKNLVASIASFSIPDIESVRTILARWLCFRPHFSWRVPSSFSFAGCE